MMLITSWGILQSVSADTLCDRILSKKCLLQWMHTYQTYHISLHLK